MIKNILVAGFLICIISGLGSATLPTAYLTYQDNGTGVFYHSFEPYSYYEYEQWWYYTNDHDETLYFKWDAIIKTVGSPGESYYYTNAFEDTTNYYHGVDLGEYSRIVGYHTPKSTTLSRTVESGNIHKLRMLNHGYAGSYTTSYIDYTLMVSETPFYTYKINGTFDCVEWVKFYIKDNTDTYRWVNQSMTSPYEFQIYNNTDYKLVFSNSYEYTFAGNNESIIYNYDACSHSVYRLEESCGNLIPDSEGFYAECLDFDLDHYVTANFYKSDGILDISNSSAQFIEVYTNTFVGRTGWIINPIVSDTTYTLENPNIAWGLKVIVVNESDGTLIGNAMVKVDQTCYCTDGYSTRQKTTVNGMVEFGDMSLQDASLLVMASGYKVLNENTTGYSAFLSGRTNFSSKTWIVKMANTSSENVSTFYEPQYKVDIHFKNEDGNRTSQIRDSDTEVYLYYENNNSEKEAMTLKFQSSSTHSYFVDEDSWTIAYDTIGHKTIANADFTPWTYAYRAIIYNSSVYGWNITIPLTVRNETKEETLHYENLTTNLWFMNEKDGKIDYREDMQIVSHARSNNTTLTTIDLEVWKDGALLCYTNLTETDYAGADFPYYYVYEPIYDYVPGSNYTTKMYGFDRTLLEVRYLECINDTITRKNKLTIGVKDRFGNNLDNCYIYLEGWGSLSTGSTYYNAYEGIGDGNYRYKATKSGYTGSGWLDATLTDGDQVVWYTLSQDIGNVSVAQQKFSDEDIKGFFFPLMYFLLICIIFGGLKYVTQ